MIKIKVSSILAEKVFKEGTRSCKVIDNALPDDARLYRSWVDVADGYRTLVLVFDDGEDEVKELQPVFQSPY